MNHRVKTVISGLGTVQLVRSMAHAAGVVVIPKDAMAPLAATMDADPEVIVFNLKHRYTGVSATVNALVPIQSGQWRLGYCGTRLSNGVKGMELSDAFRLSRKPPPGRAFRIWHVRRDHEMVAGLLARDILRLPVRLAFTSAAQRRHGQFPRWLIGKMDAVIATTELAAACVPNTTAVVPHGVDLRRFVPVDDRLAAWRQSGFPGQFGIGNFGRIRPDKGTDVFVDAMLQVLPKLPDVTAVIAGQARPEHAAFLHSLKQRVIDAGLTDRIHFLGEIPAQEIHLWYQRCLMCVACPRDEPFGLTPFEAAATASVVVCSRTGAFAHLVDPGVNGELVPTGDAQALADTVYDLMSTPYRAMRMGQQARIDIARRFSLQAEADGIGRVYKSLFEGV